MTPPIRKGKIKDISGEKTFKNNKKQYLLAYKSIPVHDESKKIWLKVSKISIFKTTILIIIKLRYVEKE